MGSAETSTELENSNTNSLTVFINGIFWDNDHWGVIKPILTNTFGSNVHHIRNSFLQHWSEAESGLKLIGIMTLLLGSGAYATNTSLMTMWNSVKDVWKKHTREDVRKLLIQGVEIGLPPDKFVSEFNKLVDFRYETINVVAHSHGGVCIHQILQAEWIGMLSKYVKINVYVLGCPIWVKCSHSSILLKQFHNKGEAMDDPVSMLCDPDAMQGIHVFETKSGFPHDSDVYVKELEKYLQNQS